MCQINIKLLKFDKFLIYSKSFLFNMDKDLKSANEYDFINDSLTLKVQSDPKYLKYISWLKENGAIFDLVINI